MARKASIAAGGLLPSPIHQEVGSVQMHRSQARMQGRGGGGLEDRRPGAPDLPTEPVSACNN